MISVSFFHVFMVNNWRNAPGGGVLARFYRSGRWGFWTLFCPRVGNSPIKKIARGFCPGGMVRLGIDWYITVNNAFQVESHFTDIRVTMKQVNKLKKNTCFDCGKYWRKGKIWKSLFQSAQLSTSPLIETLDIELGCSGLQHDPVEEEHLQ